MKKVYGEISKWTEEIKLDHLKKYLDAYVTVFRYKRINTVYIDLFAGPGECTSKTSHNPVDGSPLIALKTNPQFSAYYFCDIYKNNTDNIERLTSNYKNVSIETNDANLYVKNLIQLLNINDQTFVFLDPQALDLHYLTIELLAKTLNKVDFLINFPVGYMSDREIGSKKCYDCQTHKKECNHCLSSVFPNDEWKKIANKYWITREIKSSYDFHDQLLHLYMKPLVDLGFYWAAKPVKNSTNSQLYFLIFVSRNIIPAMKIMKDEMFKEELQASFWNKAGEIKDELTKNHCAFPTPCSLRKILEKMISGNEYRYGDFQSALRMLEQENKVKRLKPVSKRVKNFKDDEKFVFTKFVFSF